MILLDLLIETLFWQISVGLFAEHVADICLCAVKTYESMTLEELEENEDEFGEEDEAAIEMYRSVERMQVQRETILLELGFVRLIQCFFLSFFCHCFNSEFS